VQLAGAYLSNDEQTLADIRLLFARPGGGPSTEAQASGSIAKSRVLLVDTSRATLKACVGVLKQMGVHKIATMQDGYEALGRLLREPYDVIITSLHIPTIDGQSLMPVLRTIPGPNQTTPVILLTSSATAIDPTGTRPDHIVEKNPNMIQRLKRIVGGLLGVSAQEADAAGAKPPRILRKILLIDDAPAIHQLLRISFKRLPDIQIAGIEDPTVTVDFVRQ